MIHLGDITKINGGVVPVVDCAIGGSPCQDLSLAGKRAGLAGARSGLYMEQIRIIKEMRENDRANGRTGVDIRPRYMVWENVAGAFSTGTPKGGDFAAVLEEAIRAAEPEAPDIPVPEKGWPTSGCIIDEMGKWSVCWRVMDAQYWGVPQRRRRICLVCDFNGLNAPKIVFGETEHNGGTEQSGGKPSVGHTGAKSRSSVQSVPQGLSGNPDESQQERQATAGDAEECTAGAIGCDLYNGALSGDKAVSLNTNANATGAGPTVCQPVIAVDQGGGKSGAKHYEDISPTLTCTHDGAPAVAYIYDARGNGDGQKCATLTGDHQNRVTDYTSVVLEPILDDQGGSRISVRDDGKCPTLRAETHGNLPCVMETYQKVTGPLMANSHPGSYTGQDAFSDMLVAGPVEVPRNAVSVKHIVRRLTPLECERLQGFPDNWTLIGIPVEEEVADYINVFDESKYVAPNPEDFGLTADDLNGYAQVDEDDTDYYDDDPEEDPDYDRYLEYQDACEKARSKATKKVKVGSHKEVNYYYTDSSGKRRKVSDSARYKALGNSIALPPWKWVLKRLCACYERDATMASLFDGIGGFPLIWEQINGKGSCLWASEIEEFPMAVTKARFGGESL